MDPESRLWITSWSFGTGRTKKSMGLSQISPSRVNVAAECNVTRWSRVIDPAPPVTRVPTTELRRLSIGESADIAQRGAGGPATMGRKQNAPRTMRSGVW
jgi:hypothetical protein